MSILQMFYPMPKRIEPCECGEPAEYVTDGLAQGMCFFCAPCSAAATAEAWVRWNEVAAKAGKRWQLREDGSAYDLVDESGRAS